MLLTAAKRRPGRTQSTFAPGIRRVPESGMFNPAGREIVLRARKQDRGKRGVAVRSVVFRPIGNLPDRVVHYTQAGSWRTAHFSREIVLGTNSSPAWQMLNVSHSSRVDAIGLFAACPTAVRCGLCLALGAMILANGREACIRLDEAGAI